MLYSTFIKAISPLTGELLMYSGQNIESISKECARQFCEQNGLGYLHIGDEVICEIPCKIPCKKGTFEPDFDNEIDYENIKLN